MLLTAGFVGDMTSPSGKPKVIHFWQLKCLIMQIDASTDLRDTFVLQGGHSWLSYLQ